MSKIARPKTWTHFFIGILLMIAGTLIIVFGFKIELDKNGLEIDLYDILPTFIPGFVMVFASSWFLGAFRPKE
jgi:CDP-diglyceride synthetase